MQVRAAASDGSPPWRSAAIGGLAAAVGTAAALAAQVAWVVRRDLPSYDGMDCSGALPGADGSLPLHIVALGDSTLTGPGLAGPDHVWLWQAIRSLELDRSVTLASLAAGGSRAADVRRRVVEAAEQRADLVVVAVGSNDAIHATPLRRFEQDLDGLVAAVLAVAPVAAICNIGDLGNLERVPRPLATALTRRSRQVRTCIEEVVASHRRAVLLDVAATDDGFRRGGMFVADRFHPNEAGHALWAAAAGDGLRRAIAEVSPRR